VASSGNRFPVGSRWTLGAETGRSARIDSPDGRAEPVMRDRRHHEKPGLSGVEALVDPVCLLHYRPPDEPGSA
jgi:hypothetical protein